MATLVERIAERVPGLGVQLAYGEPSTVAGEEFVPVSLVCYGYGAGEGTGTVPGDANGPAREMTGAGGGGGGASLPVGAYVKRRGRLVFRANPIALLIFGLPVVMAVGGIVALARVTR